MFYGPLVSCGPCWLKLMQKYMITAAVDIVHYIFHTPVCMYILCLYRTQESDLHPILDWPVLSGSILCKFRYKLKEFTEHGWLSLILEKWFWAMFKRLQKSLYACVVSVLYDSVLDELWVCQSYIYMRSFATGFL